ncbi:MAG: hypothetical protein EOO20_00350 [Chryseobacterium sp.]|nr:MAG: hypothetical protein EOO20_00350 [Chryseobacterium sp.]
MNWTQFLLGLTAFYLFYYLLNIVFDLFRNGRTISEKSDQQELVFSEETIPEEILPEMGELRDQQVTSEKESRQSISSGLLQSSGAVGIKELFGLAQAGLIEYTKTIPY